MTAFMTAFMTIFGFDREGAVCYPQGVKLTGCLFGGVLSGVLGVAVKVLLRILNYAAKVICTFGLYIPMAYLLYGAVLWFAFGFGLFEASVDGRLYIFGFALSVGCAVVITVRKLIVKPLKDYFRGEVIEYDAKRSSPHTPEAPKIYRSRVDRGIIAYEYANRYDLYEQRGNGLALVKTEWKKNKR